MQVTIFINDRHRPVRDQSFRLIGNFNLQFTVLLIHHFQIINYWFHLSPPEEYF